ILSRRITTANNRRRSHFGTQASNSGCVWATMRRAKKITMTSGRTAKLKSWDLVTAGKEGLQIGRIATPVKLAPKISRAGLRGQRLQGRQSAWLSDARDDGGGFTPLTRSGADAPRIPPYGTGG